MTSKETLTVTTGPLPASVKVFRPGVLHPDIRVPMREIALHPKLVFPAVYCDRTRQVSDPYVDWCKRTGSSFRNMNQLFQNI